MALVERHVLEPPLSAMSEANSGQQSLALFIKDAVTMRSYGSVSIHQEVVSSDFVTLQNISSNLTSLHFTPSPLPKGYGARRSKVLGEDLKVGDQALHLGVEL